MNNRRRTTVVLVLQAALLIVLALACLLVGSVRIPVGDVLSIVMGDYSGNQAWQVIVTQARMPMIATAALSGAALAVAGLLMQTAFSNPLAGPSILGVSSGASLGVAVVMLAMGGYIGSATGGQISSLIGAFVGAVAVLALLLLFSSMVRSSTMLLIVGIMVGYLASSAISLLNFFATEQGVHSYVIWGLGNFSGVMRGQLPLFATAVAIGLVWAVLMVKPLDALLLGERYAQSMGVSVRSTRNCLLAITGLLTATVTAFCGPIGFIGLAVPHIARLMLHSSSHRLLLPASILVGADLALLCTLVSVLPTSSGVIPINAITPIVGVPVIIYVIFNRKKIDYLN